MSTTVRRSWESTALRWLEWIANPALAGLAFCLLAVGVVTWLPALAAAAHVLYRWRSEGEHQVFTGVFAAFGDYWRTLWRDGLVATAVLAVLAANLVFLGGRSSLAAFALFAVQAGIVAALVPYHLCLAAVAGRLPGRPVRDWRRSAVLVGFGGWRGPLLCLTVVVSVIGTSPVAVGPFLFGPTVPLLVALALAGRVVPEPER